MPRLLIKHLARSKLSFLHMIMCITKRGTSYTLLLQQYICLFSFQIDSVPFESTHATSVGVGA